MSPPVPVEHLGDASATVVVVLKSPPYGPQLRADGSLPYRIDHLAASGHRLTWVDPAPASEPWTSYRSRLEAATVPFAQAWRTRRARRAAAATLAMFESEGHGVALARRLGIGRRVPLAVVACWLTDLAASSSRRARRYRWLYRRVDLVVVFSGNQVPVLGRLVGIPPERIAVVRFGIDLEELAGVPTSDGGAVVAVGRDLGRDWATLVGAAEGRGWSVDLVTRARQVAGLHLPPEVALHPPMDRTRYLGLLAGAGVVVVPTDVRQYPTGQTVLLEAMALGKACVVTDTEAMREYVDDGVTAVLVPPHDAQALGDAVDALLADPERRRALGAAARAAELEHGGARAMWTAIGRRLDSLAGQNS